MIINVNGIEYLFEEFELIITNRNQENIFRKNLKRDLNYVLNKALIQPKKKLNRFANIHLEKYADYLNLPLGEFLFDLKINNNNDYKLYLNKFGDKHYCDFKLDSNLLQSKGIYCFIVNERIIYIGRSKKTFEERINEYGKITPYNCLIDGQNTNCKINSKINDLQNVNIGLYQMNNCSNNEIEKIEKKIIKYLKINLGYELWNTQVN